MRAYSASLWLRLTALLGAVVFAPLAAPAQTTPTGTGVSVTGGAAPASSRVPDGTIEFTLRVPLRPNTENVLNLTAADAAGRTATVPNLSVTQLTLTDIVRARVTSQRLTPQEVRALVAEGTIDLADPENYNVSRFIVALTIEGREVQVSVPVIRRENFEVGTGEAISIGCSAGSGGVQTTERAIAIPCGNGGGDGPLPHFEIIPFEVVADIPGQPTIPGVILIEGRIKTLKEFYKVTLYLANVSSIFTLSDVEATLELPADALSHVAPASGIVRIDTLEPGQEGSGEFIVRGDRIGTHTVTAHFGGRLSSPFLSEPVPIAGSASTDVVVKGPPQLGVRLSHPDYVVAGEPYDLTIEITNTDTELDALYASLALDVGHDARILDEETGQPADGPVDRSLGDIMRGEKRVLRYRILPFVTGAIASCTAAASQNLQLTIAFRGSGGPGCAIGTLPAERTSPDGRPTVTVVPTHNTTGVALNPAIVALFSAPMISQTITTGYPEASFKVIDPAGNVVPGNLFFGVLFEGTSAVFRPAVPFAAEQEYTIVVESSIFSEEGLQLASGSLTRFRTGAPPPAPDNQPPAVTLAVEEPLSANSIPRGQLVGVAAQVTDNVGFTRLELYLNGTLVDTKRPGTNLRFLVDTAVLAPGSTHELRGIAFDPFGNRGEQVLALRIEGDSTAPTVALLAPANVGRGGALDIVVNAADDGRVARIDLFVDSAATPVWTGLVEPFQTTLDTTTLAAGARRLRAVAVDGAGNQAAAEATVTVTADSAPPIVSFVRPIGGVEVRRGTLLQAVVAAVDNQGIASIAMFLDGEATPRGMGASGIAIDTTPLALGPHQLRARVLDTAGNPAEAVAAFTLVVTPSDSLAPNAPLVALITPTVRPDGLALLAGAPGSVEGGALLVATNLATQAVAQTTVGTDGSFTLAIEAAAGETLSLVAIDAADNRSPAALLRVPEPRRLTTLAVTPTSITLDRTTRSMQLAVVGTYNDGSTATINSGLSFASAAPAIASVTTAGLVMPGQNGSTTITVGVFEPAGVPTVAVPVTTSFPTITEVEVTPTALALTGTNQTQRLAISARFSDGTTGPFSGSVSYGSQNVSIAVVDSTGLVRSLSHGQTTITVVASGFPAVVVPVTVANRTPTELLVSPNTLVLSAVGQTVPLTLSIRYNDGSLSAAAGATLSSTDPAVVTVEANGLVTAVAEGQASILVAAQGFSASVPVTVDLPAQTPAPIITSLGRDTVGEGDSLVILGDYFSALPFDNDVTVAGVAADVLRASADRLVVRVPRGVGPGAVQVIVDGQVSNTVTVAAYPRLGTATALTGAFNVPAPAPGQSIVMGPVTLDVRAGDVVWLSGHAETVAGRQFSGLTGPAFVGTLTVTIDGTPTSIAPSPTPVDLTPHLPPGDHIVTVELAAAGGVLSTHGLALISGPPETGAFAGGWSLTGDVIAATKTLRFTQLSTTAGQPIADGTLLGVTAVNYFRASDGGCCNSSHGGTIVSGTPSTGDNRFKLVPVQNGALTVEYSDQGLYVPFAQTRTATVSVVEINGNGAPSPTRPITSATITLGSVHTASVIPDQISAAADGVDRPQSVDIDSLRDNLGNRVPDGVRVGLTAINYYRRADGGCCNNSAGGVVSGGESVPNDGSFQAVTISNGAAQLLYSPGTLALPTSDVRTATLSALVLDGNRNRIETRPFASGVVTLSGVALGAATASALPTSLAATTADNRSIVTIRNLVDAEGRPLPNGSMISVSAINWYRVSDGGCCNSSAGGAILSGTADPTDGNFRLHAVQNGSVVVTYSAAGLVLPPAATATTVVSALPATPNGKIGTRPFVAVPVTLAALTSATVTPAIPSTPADGVNRPITVTVSNIVDALGLPVPDGTRVAMTAINWYRVSDGGCCNNSHGGAFLDGDPSPSGSHFRIYTVVDGQFQATYSAASAPLIGSFGTATSFFSTLVAHVNGTVPQTRPFAAGAIALSSAANGIITATPGTLLGDASDRRSTVRVRDLTDGQGRPLPDGTRLAVTAANWYRVGDGGCCNGSFGGTIVDGAPTNNGSLRSFVVQDGGIDVTYSSAGLVRESGQMANAVVSVMQADGNGNAVGTRPMLAVPIEIVGVGSGVFAAPPTVAPGGTVSVTLSDIRDADGALVPDGTRIALTAISWYRVGDGGCCNNSAGGSITGALTAPNDGNFAVATVAGGSVTVTFQAPSTTNVTSVVSAVLAGSNANRITQTPFAAVAIRVTTTP